MASYEIDIKVVNEINGGVEVFATATKDGSPVGFGVDGTIETERFQIINPPVLVEDPLGDIIESNFNEITGETDTVTYREDPEEALKQSLGRAIVLVGKSGSNIIPGTVGNTTSTIYANNCGRHLYEVNPTSAWSTARDATESTAGKLQTSVSTGAGPYLERAASGAEFRLSRYFVNFDTSAIGTDTVSSATMSVYVHATPWDGFAEADSYATVIHQLPASDTVPAVADFDAIYATDDTNPLVAGKAMKEMCDSGQRRDFTTTTLGYHDYALNATGIAAIDGASYTNLGLVIGKDKDDTDPGSGVYKIEGLQYRGVGYTGTASDPVIVIEHAAAAAAADNALAWCNF